jgi:uncharacterized Zn ribbon protein
MVDDLSSDIIDNGFTKEHFQDSIVKVGNLVVSIKELKYKIDDAQEDFANLDWITKEHASKIIDDVFGSKLAKKDNTISEVIKDLEEKGLHIAIEYLKLGAKYQRIDDINEALNDYDLKPSKQKELLNEITKIKGEMK